MLLLENHCVALNLWVSNLKCSVTWLPPSSESVCETTYMGVQVKVQPMLVGSIFSITELHFTYLDATLRVLYLHNHFVTLVLWVRHLNCSPCWLRLAAESLDDIAHMSVQPLVHRMLVGFTFRINGLRLTYRCPALSACYVCYVFLQT